MDSGKGSAPAALSSEAVAAMGEGISIVLSQWTALQMAVENEWGGRDSRRKSQELASTVLSWFSQSKDERYIDDLENILEECMMVSFNTEIDDGSVDEVAEQLMIIHEDCLKGNFESIEKLRKLSLGRKNAVSQSKRVMGDDEDDDEDDDDEDGENLDEEVSGMAVDEPKPMEVDFSEKPKSSKEMPDEEGWSVVAPRRHKGKKPQ